MSETFAVEPAVLTAALPDVPGCVYGRSLLLSGDARVRVGASRDAALVLDPTTAVLVGRPDPELLRATLAGDPPGPALVVQADAITAATAALVGWTAQPFIVHALPRQYPPHTSLPPDVVISAPLNSAALAGLPDEIRADVLDAPAAAIHVVEGLPVAVCFVADQTETLWDIGIDTIESARRQGHATAVFLGLAAVMAGQGRQPVWASYEDYSPSLALAARLGFRPVARMAELTPPRAREQS